MIKFLLNSAILLQSFSTELNTILKDYVRPILFVLIIIGVSKGVINAIEMIADKDERGTTKDGFMKLGIIIGGVALAIIVINIAINKMTSVSMTIN